MADCKKTPDPVDIHVGHAIRTRRKAIGMSMQTLGEELGISWQQVQKHEKARNRVSASRLYHIAKVLCVPPTYFFDGYPEAT